MIHFPQFFWTYVGLVVWAIGEYFAWSPHLDLHRKLRHWAIVTYILAFVASAITAIHGW